MIVTGLLSFYLFKRNLGNALFVFNLALCRAWQGRKNGQRGKERESALETPAGSGQLI